MDSMSHKNRRSFQPNDHVEGRHAAHASDTMSTRPDEDSNSDSMTNLRRKLDQADLERLSMLNPYHPTHFRVAGHAFVDRALHALDAKVQHEHQDETHPRSRSASPRPTANGENESKSPAFRPQTPSAMDGRQQRKRLGRVGCSQAALWALRPRDDNLVGARETNLLTRNEVSDIIARHSTRTWAVGRSASPSPTRHPIHVGHGRSRSQSPTHRKRHSSPERYCGSNPGVSSIRVPLPYRLYLMHFGINAGEDVSADSESCGAPPSSIDVEKLIRVVAKSFPRDPLDPIYPVRQHISFCTDGLTPRPDTQSGRYHLLKKGLRPVSASATLPRREQMVAAQTAERDKFIRAVSACARKGLAHSTKKSAMEPTACSPSVTSSVNSSRIGSASVSNRCGTAQLRPSTATPGRNLTSACKTSQSKKGQPTVAQLRDRVKRVLSAGPHIVPRLPVPETLSDWTAPWRNRPQTPPPSGQGGSLLKSAAAADEVIIRIPEPATTVAASSKNNKEKAFKAVKTVGMRKNAGTRVGAKVDEPVNVFKGLVLPSIGLGVEVDGGNGGRGKKQVQG